MRAARREPLESQMLLCHGRPVLRAADLAAYFGLSAGALLTRIQRQHPLPGEFAFFAEPHHPLAYLQPEPRRQRPLVFTEHGALAAAYLLGSEAAIARGLQALRAFQRFRSVNSGELARVSGPVRGGHQPTTASDPVPG